MDGDRMNGDPEVYRVLESLGIAFEYYAHPPAPTIEVAREFWKDIPAAHCKNLFFRNHKGNRHYLVILDHRHDLQIRDLELRLRQGKLTFASGERMQRYLGVSPGSVTPFGLLHDRDRHVHLFIDHNLRGVPKVSFHPCINTASLVISWAGLERFLDYTGHARDYVELY